MDSKKYRQLTVYKASAGSGKTFTLALEYIKLLIVNPGSYRNILAVTFTNKATEEMKSRILYFLYGLASNLDDGDVVTFRNLIRKELGYDDEKISTNARRAMYLLIHNYTYFNIETIDSFFQRVLRNMSKELGLTAGLRLELNDTQVEEMAVDKLVDSLDKDKNLLSWITKFIFDNIDNDKRWNVIGDIKRFGKNIFSNETYYRNRESLNRFMSENDGKTRDEFVTRLVKLQRDAQDMLPKIKQEFDETITQHGIDEKIFSRKTIPSYFNKFTKFSPDRLIDEIIKSKTVATYLEGSSIDDYDGILKAKKAENEVFIEEILAPLIRKSVEVAYTADRQYNDAHLTFKNFYKLALLDRIEKKVKEINSEQNSFLLSDTQNLLGEFVSEGDSPFIYEKTGSFLEHIMIDEFQDTGTTQWRNFRILLDDCMANSDNESRTINNMLVGDVKQSIYRWRQGDWSILNDMQSTTVSNVTSLDTNFRSEKQVIDFNNRFFTFAAQFEKEREDSLRTENNAVAANLIPTEKIAAAYSDVCQKVNKKGDGGYVRITLMPKDDYDDYTLEEIEADILELLERGAQQKDIAILVRTNKSIPVIASYFAGHETIKIVSDEAFRLDSSLSVNIIIAVLRLLSNPDNNIARAYLAKVYTEDILKSDVQITDYLSDEYLPENFATRIKKISSMPVTDMLEEIYSMFNLYEIEKQDAFVCALYDSINEFVTNNTTDIESFLEEWDANLHKKTIQSSSSDGVRIMSIHKSKGLEFDNVIIPYCDWALSLRFTSLLWCEPRQGELSQLPVVPINCEKSSMRSAYADYYFDESLQNNVDNLNLLYVAFTRAGRNLFVIGKRDVASSRSYVLQQFIDTQCSGVDEDENGVLTYDEGTLTVKENKKKEEKKSLNKFKQHYESVPIKIMPGSSRAEFRQSNASRDFMADGDVDVRTGCLDRGKVLHRLMASIATAADVDREIAAFRSEGVIENEDEIRTMLHNLLNHPLIYSWFDGSWKLFNECEILMPSPTGELETCRPDRVMMKGSEIIIADYKTGNEYASYHDQVRRYMDIMQTMYPGNHVSGYLLYLDEAKVVSVK